MKKLLITGLALLGLVGCIEHREQIGSFIGELLTKAHIVSSVKEPAATGQDTSQIADRVAVLRIPEPPEVAEPHVRDVIALPAHARQTPSHISIAPAPKQNEAASGDPFDVIRSNAATMQNLDTYFSTTN